MSRGGGGGPADVLEVPSWTGHCYDSFRWGNERSITDRQLRRRPPGSKLLNAVRERGDASFVRSEGHISVAGAGTRSHTRVGDNGAHLP